MIVAIWIELRESHSNWNEVENSLRVYEPPQPVRSTSTQAAKPDLYTALLEAK